MPTPKQEKLIKLLLENIGNTEKTKTFGELLLEAGYSESISKNPYLILESEGIQEGMSDAVKEMEKIRNNGLKALQGKDLSKEKAKDIADIVDKIQKNIQLLTGGDTERVKFNPVLVKFIDEKATDN